MGGKSEKKCTGRRKMYRQGNQERHRDRKTKSGSGWAHDQRLLICYVEGTGYRVEGSGYKTTERQDHNEKRSWESERF